MNGLNSAALDRYITGNYGEDQFRGLVECPACGEYYNSEECALSRKDNKTMICSQCGVDEAMESFNERR